jgi:zinc protease
MRAGDEKYQAPALQRVVIAVAGLVITLTIAATLALPAWALEIKRMTLNNGAILLVSEQHQLPMVTAAIAFDAGSRRDPAGKEGLQR